MSVSSPEVSLSSSSTTSSSTKDDVDYWEVNPPPTPASLERLASLNCWDYSIELDCLKGPEGFTTFLPLQLQPNIIQSTWFKSVISFNLNSTSFTADQKNCLQLALHSDFLCSKLQSQLWTWDFCCYVCQFTKLKSIQKQKPKKNRQTHVIFHVNPVISEYYYCLRLIKNYV